MREKPPLQLDGRASGLDAARKALAPPQRRRTSAWLALLCAALMAVAALALAAVVVLGGWEPGRAREPDAVRQRLAGS